MAAAADIVEELGPDVCDINMGCPANKVLKGCAGAALMGDLPLARRIVRSVRERLSIPLTVKFRLGLDERRVNFLDLAAICEDEGVAAVAMHARTARQMYTGRADYPHRRAEEPGQDPGHRQRRRDDARGRPSPLRADRCDAIMIGRATMKNPWIFRQIAAGMAGRSEAEAEVDAAREPTLSERRDLMLAHFSAIEETAHDPKEALHKLRTMTGWYTNGLPHGRALRIRISELATPSDFREAVGDFFRGLEQGAAAA